MHIRLQNEIDLDGQIEVIDQVYPVDVTEKNGLFYLIFTNEEEEKVALKAGDSELVMTRFSNPKSIMRFIKEQEAVVTIPTPMGIQHFVTDTYHYLLDRQKQSIDLHYVLRALESEQEFARYQMKISWKWIKRFQNEIFLKSPKNLL